MRIKRVLNIGDKFLTWEVIRLVNPKKYRYLCKCKVCGVEREFIKYNLLRGSYAPCKKCGHKEIGNVATIKKHWNYELNGVIFDKPENFKLTQSYWFKCNKGHNFKSSIKDFSLSRCLSCNEQPPNHPSKYQIKEYIIQFLSKITRIKEHDNFNIELIDFKTIIHLVEVDRYSSYRNYFDSDSSMVDEITKVKSIENNFKSLGYNYLEFKVEKKLKTNVDNFIFFMVDLIHS